MAGTRSSKYALKRDIFQIKVAGRRTLSAVFPFETDDDVISVRSLSRLSVPFDERFSLATMLRAVAIARAARQRAGDPSLWRAGATSIVGKDFLPAIALEEPVVGQGHGRFANCAMME